ncbi:hypothetical protein F383_38942 [Gossypium arboreum]|uniref:Uncharacterized protein n=1 Tax=Gossypium arboreum TaxID=29729 RepID=A0A0B0MI54_GOSAR|nr:hypothetical protein F383_38942 [Gossypium arboreum]
MCSTKCRLLHVPD